MIDLRTLAGRPRYLAFLPDFLFHADDNKARYVVKAWLLALLPSILLATAVSLVAPDAQIHLPTGDVVNGHGLLGQDGGVAPDAQRVDIPLRGNMLPVMIVLLVAVGPLLETLLMTPVVLGVNRVAGAGPAVVVNAMLWGIVHSLQRPVWGLVVWWPFLILSIALVTWRARGIGTAILIVTCIHGLQNSVTAVLLLLMGTG